MPIPRICRLSAIGLMLAVTITQAQAATKTYEVRVKTSNVKGAGTDAKVYITFIGVGGQTSEKLRLDTSGSDFEQDDLGKYYVSTEKEIGVIKEIKMEHDNSDNSAGWHLAWVEVFAPRFSKTVPIGGIDADKLDRPYDYYRFTFNRWLADDELDRNCYCTRVRDGFEDAVTTREAGRIFKEKYLGASLLRCQTPSEELTVKVTCSLSESVAVGVETVKETGNTTTVGVSLTAEGETGFGSVSSTLSVENTAEVRHTATESTSRTSEKVDVKETERTITVKDGEIALLITEVYARQTDPGEITLGKVKVPFVKRSAIIERDVVHYYTPHSPKLVAFVHKLRKESPHLFTGSTVDKINDYLPEDAQVTRWVE